MNEIKKNEEIMHEVIHKAHLVDNEYHEKRSIHELEVKKYEIYIKDLEKELHQMHNEIEYYKKEIKISHSILAE
jgi:hypothetical protein